MKNNKKKYAFTFVELVATITVLTILGSVGIVSYLDFLPNSRDAVRIAHLAEIEKSFNNYKTVSKFPLPDKKIEIKVNNELAGYQGYLSDSILSTVGYTGVDGGVDPTDGIFYTYYASRDLKNFQFLSYLENDSEKKVSSFLVNKANAKTVDYTKRYPYLVGTKLGILVENNTNKPIQDFYSIQSQGYINFTGSLVGNFKLQIDNGIQYTSLNNILVGEKIKELANLKDTKVSDTLVLSYPTGIDSTFQTDTSFDVSWNYVEAATSYGLYLNSVYLGETSSSGVQVSGLTPNTSYNFSVSAKTIHQESPQSSLLSVFTSFPPPSSVSQIGANGNQLFVSWPTVVGIGSYGVYKNGSLVGTTSSNTATISGLDGNTAYNINIVSIKSPTSISGFSPTGVFSTAPSTPDPLTYTAGNQTQISFSWPVMSGAMYYSIYRNGSFLGTGVSNSTSVTGLSPGTSYNFNVAAIKTPTIASGLSPTYSFSTAPPPPSTIVKTHVSNDTISLNWNSVATASGYAIYKKIPGPSWSLIGVTYSNDADLEGFSANTAYTLAIRSFNSFNFFGDYSADQNITTAPNTIGAITNLHTTAVGTGTFTITWDVLGAARQYYVYDKAHFMVNSSGSATNNLTAFGLSSNTTYRVSVAGVEGYGSYGKLFPSGDEVSGFGPKATINVTTH